MSEIFSFPSAPAGAVEWPGRMIGISNLLTRTRGPAPRRRDGDQLLVHARRALEGRDAFIQDAVFHGVCVRLFTTSHHLFDFWCDYGYSVSEWLDLTGRRADPPSLTIYAVRAPEIEEGVYESRDESFLFNTSWFGDLRAAVRAGLARRGLSVVGASAVERNGRALVCCGAPGRSWSAFGLVERGASHIADDAVVIRMDSGKAWASRLEKGLYLRTDLVEAFPAHAAGVLQGKFENVPEASPGLLDTRARALQDLEAAAMLSRDAGAVRFLQGQPPGQLRNLLARLTAFDGARFLASPARFFDKRRVLGPLEEVPVGAVAMLRKDPGDTLVVTSRPARPGDESESRLSACAPTYDVNLAFQAQTPREAAELGARLLERLADQTPADLRRTSSDFREFLA